MQPRGIRNNNPLNIMHSEDILWHGEISPDAGNYCVFSSEVYGIRAAFVILREYNEKYGCDTLESIIGRWAPPTANDTRSYISDVCHRTSFFRNTVIATEQTKTELLSAMIWHENGCNPYDAAIFNEAYNLSKRR